MTFRERPVVFTLRNRKASWSFQKTTVCDMRWPTAYFFGNITRVVTATAPSARTMRNEIAFFLSIFLPSSADSNRQERATAEYLSVAIAAREVISRLPRSISGHRIWVKIPRLPLVRNLHLHNRHKALARLPRKL